MTPAKPSLGLLRALTDEHVVRALITEPRLTRAEISARTGISKPTVSESVRRLCEAGLIRDTGERTTGRGRVGTYFGLAEDLGVALVVVISPEGVLGETVDVHGDVTREIEQLERPTNPEAVTEALRLVAGRVVASAPGPVRLCVVSAADPVDRISGRLVHLPDAPFLVGELNPVAILAPLAVGPITVDNDVNWAARAERMAAQTLAPDDFAYLYLGEGLGCAVVADGEVRRGHAGLAGEIAHLLTRGPGGRAVPFTQVFADLELRRPGSTAIDVPALLRAVDAGAGTDGAGAALGPLADAICGVVAALVALTDPELVVLGGPWGTHPAVVGAVAARASTEARQVPVRPAQVADEAPLAGARHWALQELREAVLAMRPLGAAPPLPPLVS
jgi:predicted NBD/HSP70 family sugar kinase